MMMKVLEALQYDYYSPESRGSFVGALIMQEARRKDGANDPSIGVFAWFTQFPQELRWDLSIEYYLNRSANKTISPMWSRLLDASENYTGGGNIWTQKFLADSIISKYGHKWDEALTYLRGEALSTNIEYSETKEAVLEKTEEIVYGGRNERTKTGTVTKTTDGSVTKTGTVTTDDDDEFENTASTNKKVTTTTQTGIAGFNSSNFNKYDNETTEETGDKSNNYTTTEGHNYKDKKETYDTLVETDDTITDTYNTTDVDAKTGTDTIDGGHTITETRSGHNIPTQELFIMNMDLRKKLNFFNMIFEDVDSILVSPMYN